MNKSPVPRRLVLEVLKEFPKAGSLTLAHVLLNRAPSVFKNTEAARNSIRYYRGNKGNALRSKLKMKDHVRPNGNPAVSPFPDLPEGLTSFADWKPLDIDGPMRVLDLADIHIPYHDKKAIEVAVERADEPDLILLNGDFLDCYEVSSFQPDPRKCDFAGMLKTGITFIEWIRGKFPKARIIFKEGNHEERLERYFTTRAPAVLGCEEFQLKNLMKLDNYGVEWLGEKRPICLGGKFYVIHGHEFRMAFSNPVNPARGLFLRAKVHAIEGHYHQSSQHAERTLAGKTLSTWSTGCLCDLHPEYMPLNNWVHGAAIIDIDARGAFHVDNFRIINGQAY